MVMFNLVLKMAALLETKRKENDTEINGERKLLSCLE